ncbi:MAG: NAD(+) synthase [Firmicutes bacterium]|nr:NAD(+) synthase [Bacillota bacterium]
MKDGFIKVAAASIKGKVADPKYNREKIVEVIQQASQEDVKLLVLPELVLTSYTCNDLFWHRNLLESSLAELQTILECTKTTDMVTVLGMPIAVNTKLYNCALFIQKGNILGVVPKHYLPNYSEFYEARHFTPGNTKVESIKLLNQEVPFGMNLLFCCEEMPDLVLAAEVCEDLWVPLPPSTLHALAGATVICNPSASDEVTTKENYRRSLVSNQSARLIAAYLYASVGEGESTQDLVYSGHHLIAENGSILTESKRFVNEMIQCEIDVQRLVNDRRKMTTYQNEMGTDYKKVYFHLDLKETKIERYFSKTPFIPENKVEREKRCDEILTIQAMGLKKRLEHTNCKSSVIGISGGLDSTLAVLVVARAYDLLGWDRKDIICVTMPCFGTTDRTYTNACELVEQLGATLKEIRINKAVEQHFKDIEHDPSVHDVTYENSQARERTQILMDIANQMNGMVIGTGDMSELALGWATYNGDHMSMYAVNSSVPKMLVRYIVQYYAECMCKEETLKNILLDILDTPVSPELLPPVDGVISQKTEDLVGPYELHDFFLYYLLRFGFSPKKIFRLSCYAFEGVYTKEILYKWLRTFLWRFFAQQFKRSCIPDGPKVGSIALSPRGDLRMPSDASAAMWMNEMNELEKELRATNVIYTQVKGDKI